MDISRCTVNRTLKILIVVNQDSVFRVMTGLWAGCLGIVIQFLAEAKHFPLLHSLQMGSGVHPASFSVDTSGIFHAGKATDYETDYLPPSSIKV
jgi:hypothetical protein